MPKYPNEYIGRETPVKDYIDDVVERVEAEPIPTNYEELKAVIDEEIEKFLQTSEDKHAAKGMTECYLETWQAFCMYIGRTYIKKTGINLNIQKCRAQGSIHYDENNLILLMDLYAEYCAEFRKQFFISDYCAFAGVSFQYAYSLTHSQSSIHKKCEYYQEASLRGALIGGRANPTAALALLNHDYGYTTSRVAHEQNIQIKNTADTLPALDIVCDDNIGIEEKY